MAAVRVLVDTDVLIDYLNDGRYAGILDDRTNRVYYSVVTRKELLAKEGLRDSERKAIMEALRRLRLVPVSRGIALRYSAIRSRHPSLEREDALIAATAIEKQLPLITRNWRHFRQIEDLKLFTGT